MTADRPTPEELDAAHVQASGLVCNNLRGEEPSGAPYERALVPVLVGIIDWFVRAHAARVGVPPDVLWIQMADRMSHGYEPPDVGPEEGRFDG